MSITEELQRRFVPLKQEIKQPARGALKYPYLAPAPKQGRYPEQWDWDAFFMGMSLAVADPQEAGWLQGWCLNCLTHVRQRDGFTPGLLTPTGPKKKIKHMKPFLAQGCYFASTFLGNFSWLNPFWGRLERSLAYWDSGRRFDRMRGLAVWYNAMQSGADDNVATYGHVWDRRGRTNLVIGVDLNSYLYREYLAMARLAGRLHRSRDRQRFQAKAASRKQAILDHLWSEGDRCFYNLNRRTGRWIRGVTFSSLVPLWAGLVHPRAGREMIRRYVIAAEHLRAPFGIRTLSRQHPRYDQRNRWKPCSNWRGPVWILVNYLGMHALLHYGFRAEARRLAATTARLCLDDLKTNNNHMHECYDADSGTPLAVDTFVSWNLLAEHLVPQAQSGYDPFRLT